MRGRLAKTIRRSVYGDLSRRIRKYRRLGNRQIVRDQRRQLYQRAKREVLAEKRRKDFTRVFHRVEQRVAKQARRRAKAEERRKQ